MRSYSPVHIDFNTCKCCETFYSKVNYIVNRISGMTNPYTGNKRNIIPTMLNLLEKENIEYDSVLDLFSGSAYVSMAMKYMGKNVISNDILLSSYYYAKAFVENDFMKISEEQKDYLLNNENKDRSSFVEENFHNRFTDNEAKFLDNFHANAKNLDNDYAEALAFSNMQMYIEDRCFLGGRLNNGQIIAELDFRISHNRNKGFEMPFTNMRWYSFVDDFNTVTCCKSFCEDSIELLESGNVGVDLAYIDPPYGGQQSDYGFMYNFLESYVRQQLPEKWPTAQHMKRFVKKDDYEDNFIEMIELVSDIPVLVVSYNNSSWSEIDHIKEILFRHRDEVQAIEVNYDYNYRDKKNKSGVEYLIIAR